MPVYLRSPAPRTLMEASTSCAREWYPSSTNGRGTEASMPAPTGRRAYSGSSPSGRRSRTETQARAHSPSHARRASVIGGDLTVETFEQLVAEVGDQPPGPGSALMVTPISMDPAKVDENLAFFKSDVLPRIKASAGFQAVRNMINRETGQGLVGSAWASQDAMKAASAEAMARREEGVARGVNFGETSYREILFADVR